MDRFFIKKAVTATVFTSVLFAGFILNMRNSYQQLKNNVSSDLKEGKSVTELIETVDATINENTFAKYPCIEAYGYVQRLLNKDEENDFEVIRDKDGSLHFTYFGTEAKDMSNLADKVEFFKDHLTNKQTKVIYACTPDKVIEGVTKFNTGLPYNYANETADALLTELAERNIATIDFRDGIMDSGIPYSDLFFKTDHHWTIQTSFWAYTYLVDQLTEHFGMKVENASYYTDINNYNVITYPNSFIGSLGRKTGIYYSGVDDFSLIYPKFYTDYTFTTTLEDSKLQTTGIFNESLLNLAYMRYDKGKYDIQGDRYSTYLYGNHGIAHIQNNTIKNGPKVLLVKDSYMVPVASFLSTVCSDVYLVDPRYYEGNIIDYVNTIPDLDYALISFIPQDLTEEFFRFE
ncbi:MAG: DHHW family protein [bacterium]|nr:DHHW family protein [bacterium]